MRCPLPRSGNVDSEAMCLRQQGCPWVGHRAGRKIHPISFVFDPMRWLWSFSVPEHCSPPWKGY
jgi:hypothetical protein